MLVGLRVVRKNRVDSIRLVMMIWNVLHSKHGILLWPVHVKESRCRRVMMDGVQCSQAG
jgi:hypothetical protein